MQIDSFRTRLVLYFGGLILLVSLGLTWYLDRQASQTLTRASSEALYSMANAAALMLGRNLAEREREIQLLSQSYLLQQLDWSSTAVQQRLADIKATYKYYAWIGIAGPDGTVLNATDQLLVGNDVSARPWFSGGAQGSYIGDVHEAVLLAKLLGSADADEPLRFIDFAAPVVHKKNGQRAVIASHVNWDWVRDILQSAVVTHAGKQGVQPLLLGAQGHWLHPFEQIGRLAIPDNLPAPGQVEIITWGDEGEFLTVRLSVTAKTHTELGWQLVLRQPVATALLPVNELKQRLFLYCAVSLLGSILLAYQLARRFSRPIEQLARSAEKIAQGGEQVVFSVNSSLREVGRLSLALSKMMSQLANKRLALQQANSNLEQQVALRTAQLQQANASLELLSRQDALTGIYNRRGADEQLTNEFARLQRGGAAYAILLLDIDHFKQINDTLGHEAGDQVIQAVAALLQQNVRQTDFVARYGGEEFLIILSHSTAERAAAIAEKLRQIIASNHQSDAGYVTVSIGVALATAADSTAETAVRLADEAMYQAKRAGRNRVHVKA